MNKIIFIIVIIILLLVGAIGYLIMTGGILGNPSPTPTPAHFEIQGMTVDILDRGAGLGIQAKLGSAVTVEEIDKTPDGKIVFSSKAENHYPTITLGSGYEPKGITLGMVGMRVGEVRRFVIPPDLLASNYFGYPSYFPPNTTLTTEIKLLNIK